VKSGGSPVGGRGRVRGLLIATVAILGLAAQGCGQMSYPSPPPPLVPTVVGVVDRVGLAGTGWLATLRDGQEVEVPHQADVQLMGAIPVAGDLVLASTAAPRFVDVLEPIETGEQGCWEAWLNPVAWDMGDTVLFSDGIELPKAQGFHAPEPTQVNGRLGWAAPPSGLRWTFCANSQGQIEWAQPPQ
jgi:hypothetical protein